MSTPLEIAAIASSRAFGAKIVTNINRGLVVEAIVSTALGPDWLWCSEDYYQFDFRHRSGLGLEVKQSAACQSWETKVPSVARWDIAARKGFYEGPNYVEKPGRSAAIYVLAWHPLIDRATVDHRDPAQWEFYVLSTMQLKPTKSMGLVRARQLTSPVGISRLPSAVALVLSRLIGEDGPGG